MSSNRPPNDDKSKKPRTLKDIEQGIKEGTIKPNKIKLPPLPKKVRAPTAPIGKPSKFEIQARIKRAEQENPAPNISPPKKPKPLRGRSRNTSTAPRKPFAAKPWLGAQKPESEEQVDSKPTKKPKTP